MAWVFDDNRSIYIQLVEQIQTKIITGIYEPGSRLPAVRVLAAEAGVNPNTMQRALSELERTGLVYSVRTSGRFVSDNEGMIAEIKKDFAKKEASEFCKKMHELGFTDEEAAELVRNNSRGKTKL